MLAPIFNPQSPFQNSFSGLLWYLKQKIHPRSYLDRASGGSRKPLSSSMSEGQMQLAMEESDERKSRDVRAIQWLIHNRTEDDEMESFVAAIPGAFTSRWGIDVWKRVSEVKRYDEDMNSRSNDPTLSTQGDAHLRVSVPSHPPLTQRARRPFNLLRPLRRVIANDIPHDVTLTQSLPRLPSDPQALDHPYPNGDLAIYDLCKRVRHLIDTCDRNAGFSNEEQWRRRARACVATVASLVLCANIELELFGDIDRLILKLTQLSGPMPFTGPGSDGTLVARLNCLTVVAISRMLAKDTICVDARSAIDSIARLGMEGDSEQIDDGNGDENAFRSARRIDEYFKTATQFCVVGLRGVFRPLEGGTTEAAWVRETLEHNHEVDVSMVQRISLEADRMVNIDKAILRVVQRILDTTSHLVARLPVHHDLFEETKLIEPIQFFNSSIDLGPIFHPQFIFLGQRLRLLCSYAPKLRDIIEGRENGAYQAMLESLTTLWALGDSPEHRWTIVRHRHLMERQLWRLEDLRDGCGFGYKVELFFLVLEQLSRVPISPDPDFALFLGTFRIIASDWRQYKHSFGTQCVILNLICDMVIPNRGPTSNQIYPKPITDELLVLLRNMVSGQSGWHIDSAMEELDKAWHDVIPYWLRVAKVPDAEISLFRAEVIKVISCSRAPPSS